MAVPSPCPARACSATRRLAFPTLSCTPGSAERHQSIFAGSITRFASAIPAFQRHAQRRPPGAGDFELAAATARSPTCSPSRAAATCCSPRRRRRAPARATHELTYPGVTLQRPRSRDRAPPTLSRRATPLLDAHDPERPARRSGRLLRRAHRRAGDEDPRLGLERPARRRLVHPCSAARRARCCVDARSGLVASPAALAASTAASACPSASGSARAGRRSRSTASS